MDPVPQSSPIAAPVEKKSNSKVLIASAIILIVLGIIIASLRYFQLTSRKISSGSENVQPTGGGVGITAIPSNNNRFIETADVTWNAQPEKVQSPGFFTAVDSLVPFELQYCKTGSCLENDSDILTDKYEPKTTYYKVGTMKTKYPGGTIYLAITKGLPESHIFKGIPTLKDILNDGELVTLFIKLSDGRFILTGDYNNSQIVRQQIEKLREGDIVYDELLKLDTVGSNQNLNINGYKLYVSRTAHLFESKDYFFVKDLNDGNQIFSDQDITKKQLKLKAIVMPKLILKLPTGLFAEINYHYVSSIVYKRSANPDTYNPYIGPDSPTMNWTSQLPPPQVLQKKPSEDRQISDFDSIIYTSNFDDCRGTLSEEKLAGENETIDLDSDLEKVAESSNGETIYQLKKMDYSLFDNFYFNKIVMSNLGEVPFEDYLSYKPVLISKDQFGIYRMIYRAELINTACWGEPLIYLYPEEKTPVSIKLNNSIEITESEPLYQGGWDVIAYPDGSIYSPDKNRTYSYLYWEGNALKPRLPVARSSVRRDQIKEYFEDSLTVLGLNKKEINDFTHYWVPKLNNAPYYIIEFYDAGELEKVAPHSVQPKPQTSIRILMQYFELENDDAHIQKIDLDTYLTPIRKGFTFVEWGGILKSLQ